jgi:hypothetical protein
MKNNHQDHMTVLLIFILFIAIFSLFFGFRLFAGMSNEAFMSIFAFSIAFLNLIILVVIASFVLKIYENMYYKK